MKNLLSILFTLITINGFSCSCMGNGKINDEQFNSYDLIVKGKIEKVQVENLRRTIYVRVEKLYKGTIKSKLVILSSPSQSGLCGIFPTVGETWLYFANESGNAFSTHLCTRTKNMNPKAWTWDSYKDEIEDDLKYLENKIEKK